MIEHRDADLSGSRFRNVNLTDTRIHSAFLNGLVITDAWIENVRIDGNVQSLTVNGIDVTAYVEAELDRLHPDRRRLGATDLDGLREAWNDAIARTDTAVERARRLPAALLDERVNDEFSFLQTLRHLVFAHDRWLTGPVFGDPAPYFHSLGQPHDSALEGRADGLDPDARPTLDEVLAVRHEQRGRLADFLETAVDADLSRTLESPNGGDTMVLHCIQVVLHEEWWHHQYAARDLASSKRAPLTGSSSGRPPCWPRSCAAYRRPAAAPQSTEIVSRTIQIFEPDLNALQRPNPAGTCAMGTDPVGRRGSVGQVHGVENLFVADASVIPEIPAAEHEPSDDHDRRTQGPHHRRSVELRRTRARECDTISRRKRTDRRLWSGDRARTPIADRARVGAPGGPSCAPLTRVGEACPSRHRPPAPSG